MGSGILPWLLIGAGVWLAVSTYHSVAGVRWLNFLHPPVPAALRVAPSVIGMHLLRIAACIWICLVLAGTGRMLSR
ncbi:MAG: hypothetical protein ABII00_14830, partial [Elusimicrobiota bacterium]